MSRDRLTTLPRASDDDDDEAMTGVAEDGTIHRKELWTNR